MKYEKTIPYSFSRKGFEKANRLYYKLDERTAVFSTEFTPLNIFAIFVESLGERRTVNRRGRRGLTGRGMVRGWWASQPLAPVASAEKLSMRFSSTTFLVQPSFSEAALCSSPLHPSLFAIFSYTYIYTF